LFGWAEQSDVQAIGYLAAPPNTTITTSFAAGSPAYPSMAILTVVTAQWGLQVSAINGTLINGQYQYTFNDGPHGLAGLGFFLPANAHLGKVAVTSTCGNATSTITFHVTKDDPDDGGDNRASGSSGYDDVLPALTGSGGSTGAAHRAHTTTWRFALPSSAVVPAEVTSTTHTSVSTRTTRQHGHTVRTLVFTFPR
jgi:hypothetical protein